MCLTQFFKKKKEGIATKVAKGPDTKEKHKKFSSHNKEASEGAQHDNTNVYK